MEMNIARSELISALARVQGIVERRPINRIIANVLLKAQAPDTLVGAVFTSKMLLAGQTETLSFDLKPGDGGLMDSYYAEIYVDPVTPNFRECRPENNKSDVVTPDCIK